ncbi:hypothetical protein BLOT_001682, partial [Blomia tropicalis]
LNVGCSHKLATIQWVVLIDRNIPAVDPLATTSEKSQTREYNLLHRIQTILATYVYFPYQM